MPAHSGDITLSVFSCNYINTAVIVITNFLQRWFLINPVRAFKNAQYYLTLNYYHLCIKNNIRFL